MFPAARLAGLAGGAASYSWFAHSLALLPGLPGSYLRVAYYRFTLEKVGRDCQIGFGSYFAHPQASLGSGVDLGAYCVLGQVDIGEGTLLASRVQILSGSPQHTRDSAGRLVDKDRSFRRISVGPRCQIGAAAIVLADVGENNSCSQTQDKKLCLQGQEISHNNLNRLPLVYLRHTPRTGSTGTGCKPRGGTALPRSSQSSPATVGTGLLNPSSNPRSVLSRRLSTTASSTRIY